MSRKHKPQLVNIANRNYNSHTLYTKDDFTQEEIDNNNLIAQFVIGMDFDICKRCGAAEAELDDNYCKAKREEKYEEAYTRQPTQH